MSELEHALRSALADPPGARPRDTDALYDIELRLTRRRQRRRRTGIGALAVAAVAAIAIPIGVAGPHLGSSASNGSGVRSAGGGGGALAAPSTTTAPAAVRKAAANLAGAPGSHPNRTVSWVRTTAEKWDRLADNVGAGQTNIAVYVIELRGHFTCYGCSRPEGARAPTGIAQVTVVPVRAGQHYRTGFGPSPRPYDLAKLGDVHTFTLH
jgi:hypothetical protein